MIELLVKVTAILTLALAVNALCRRTSAAALHLLMLAAIVSVLVFPLVHLPGQAQVNARILVSSPPAEVIANAHRETPLNLPAVLTGLWICGGLLVLVRLGAGLGWVWWITRCARSAPSLLASTRVPIYLSKAVSLPMTWGFIRPVILLPESSVSWPLARVRNVIAHEQAHIDRHDWLSQMAAEAACALYWFHPLVWIAVRVLLRESERACDDSVLLSGVSATAYASDLVEIARISRRAPTGVLPMAMHNLEVRVRELLDDRRIRRVPGRFATALLTTAALAAILPLAALHLTAQTYGGRISGSVRDASSAVVPGANVGAENLDADNQEAATTDAVGRFQFTNLPPGRYRISVQGPGFKVFRSEPLLVNGAEAHLDATLDIGGVFERIQVVGQRQTPSQHTVNGTPQRIRVGGNVQATKLLTKVDPVYPQHALEAGIQGTVLMNAVIRMDGTPASLNVVSKSPDPELVTAALDAVRQWRYQPVLLNGAPVEVVTTIAVTFRLKD